MAKIINLTPYLEEPRPCKAPAYAVHIPLRDYHPAPKRASFLRLAAQITDIALSLGLGALMLVILLVILVSL